MTLGEPFVLATVGEGTDPMACVDSLRECADELLPPKLQREPVSVGVKILDHFVAAGSATISFPIVSCHASATEMICA
jgi:hypothetical protein